MGDEWLSTHPAGRYKTADIRTRATHTILHSMATSQTGWELSTDWTEDHGDTRQPIIKLHTSSVPYLVREASRANTDSTNKKQQSKSRGTTPSINEVWGNSSMWPVDDIPLGTWIPRNLQMLKFWLNWS